MTRISEATQVNLQNGDLVPIARPGDNRALSADVMAAVDAALEVLTPGDIGAATSAQGTLAETAVQPADMAAAIALAIQEAIMFTYEPNGTDQLLTVNDTVGGVSWSAFPAGTTDVLVTTDAAAARFTIDGGAPTASVGNLINSGEERVWPIAMITAMKAIRTTAVSALWTGSPLKKVSA